MGRRAILIVTKYNIPGSRRIRIALVADLHDNDYTQLISEIRTASPDLIAAVGDIMNENDDDLSIPEEQRYAIGFLEEAVKIAPTFYSLGNNEKIVDDCEEMIHWSLIKETGVILLDNSYTNWNGIWIGGLTSAYSHISYNCAMAVHHHSHMHFYSILHHKDSVERRLPNTAWLKKFDALSGFKILLCHHPEYYPEYLVDTGIDLIFSGHAHGGEWRIFNRGIYAPGQGIFPKLTSGVHYGRLVISRGLANTARVPRINNPTELVIVEINPLS